MKSRSSKGKMILLLPITRYMLNWKGTGKEMWPVETFCLILLCISQYGDLENKVKVMKRLHDLTSTYYHIYVKFEENRWRDVTCRGNLSYFLVYCATQWPWKWGQGHEKLMQSCYHQLLPTCQIWSESVNRCWHSHGHNVVHRPPSQPPSQPDDQGDYNIPLCLAAGDKNWPGHCVLTVLARLQALSGEFIIS